MFANFMTQMLGLDDTIAEATVTLRVVAVVFIVCMVILTVAVVATCIFEKQQIRTALSWASYAVAGAVIATVLDDYGLSSRAFGVALIAFIVAVFVIDEIRKRLILKRMLARVKDVQERVAAVNQQVSEAVDSAKQSQSKAQ